MFESIFTSLTKAGQAGSALAHDGGTPIVVHAEAALHGRAGLMTDADIQESLSAHPFDATVKRVTAAIASAGLTVFSRIDHHEGARAAGLEMPPATVLTYGTPKGGTPVMVAAPLAALDLPLRVLIRVRDDGQTAIAFHPVGEMLRRAGVPAPLAERLAPAQRILLAAVAP